MNDPDPPSAEFSGDYDPNYFVPKPDQEGVTISGNFTGPFMYPEAAVRFGARLGWPTNPFDFLAEEIDVDRERRSRSTRRIP